MSWRDWLIGLAFALLIILVAASGCVLTSGRVRYRDPEGTELDVDVEGEYTGASETALGVTLPR